MKIYLSAPLFTQAERRWNRRLAAGLQEHIVGAQVLLPQDFQFGQAYNSRRAFPKIFRACVAAVREADVVVAVLDGSDVDSGTALELGVAYERGIPIVGVRTDYRESQDRGVNLVIAGACAVFLREMSFGEDVDQLIKDLSGKIVLALKKAGTKASLRKGLPPSHAAAADGPAE